jgi:hypothetical protein
VSAWGERAGESGRRQHEEGRRPRGEEREDDADWGDRGAAALIVGRKVDRVKDGRGRIDRSETFFST